MNQNIQEFISYHNNHILDIELAASFEKISAFAAKKNVALTDLSIEKHRLPFINYITSLENSKV